MEQLPDPALLPYVFQTSRARQVQNGESSEWQMCLLKLRPRLDQWQPCATAYRSTSPYPVSMHACWPAQKGKVYFLRTRVASLGEVLTWVWHNSHVLPPLRSGSNLKFPARPAKALGAQPLQEEIRKLLRLSHRKPKIEAWRCNLVCRP